MKLGLRRGRHTVRLSLLLASVGAVVAYPMVAWACTTMTATFSWAPDGIVPSAHPGDQLAGVLNSWWNGPVQIYWGPRANNRLLKTVQGPGTNITVTVPTDATPGSHTFSAYAADQKGNVAERTRPVDVVSAPAPVGAPPPVVINPQGGDAPVSPGGGGVSAGAAAPGAVPRVIAPHRSVASRSVNASGVAPPGDAAAVRPDSPPDAQVPAATSSGNANATGDLWSGFAKPGARSVIGIGNSVAPGRHDAFQFAIGGLLLLIGMGALGTVAALRLRGRTRSRAGVAR